MKWQRSWDASDTDRHLYDYKPKVSLKTPAYMFISFIEEKTVISQLRLGYTLNEYRYKVTYKTLQTVAVVGLRLWTITNVTVSYMNWNDKSYSHNYSTKQENKVLVQNIP